MGWPCRPPTCGRGRQPDSKSRGNRSTCVPGGLGSVLRTRSRCPPVSGAVQSLVSNRVSTALQSATAVAVGADLRSVVEGVNDGKVGGLMTGASASSVEGVHRWARPWLRWLWVFLVIAFGLTAAGAWSNGDVAFA